MNLRILHLLSGYTLWCLGTYALWLGEWEDIFAYPIVVALCAVIAFFATDLYHKLELSPLLSNTLGVIIVGKMLYDLMQDGQEALTALAHFLCYLQVAKWFREKRSLDFALIYLMNILQVAIGAILAKQSKFGLIIMVYFFLAIWCGFLYFIGRHANAFDDEDESSTATTFTRAMLWTSIRRTAIVWVFAIPIALVIFWLLPRTQQETTLADLRSIQRQWTGFSSVVKLENETTIFESSEIAFTVLSATDDEGKDIEIPPDILWRGSVFTNYDEGEWKRTRRDLNLNSDPLHHYSDGDLPPGTWAIQIDRVVNTGDVLFAPAGVIGGSSSRSRSWLAFYPTEERTFLKHDHSASPSGRFTYEIVVDPKRFASGMTSWEAPSRPYLEVVSRRPPRLSRTQALVDDLVKGVPADDFKERIRRLSAYLADSGQYQYALAAPTVTKGIDPIEDFLFYRKTGHCEYFASSLAVLLRMAGIPSRLVTGFKGVDLNRAGRYYQVRQLYAHAWVEAYLPDEQHWLTLDPTPSEARASLVEKQRSWFDIVDDVRDMFARIWGYYIVNFNFDDQMRVVQGVGSWLVTWIGSPMVTLQQRLLALWQERSWVVVILASSCLLLFSFLSWMAFIFGRWSWRRWNRTSDGALYVPAYDEWINFLRRHGLSRRRDQTPQEFAQRVELVLEAREQTRPWASLAVEFSDAWYEARFGERTLPEERWQALRERVDSLSRRVFVDRIRRL